MSQSSRTTLGEGGDVSRAYVLFLTPPRPATAEERVRPCDLRAFYTYLISVSLDSVRMGHFPMVIPPIQVAIPLEPLPRLRHHAFDSGRPLSRVYLS